MKSSELVKACTTNSELRDLLWALIEEMGPAKVLEIATEYTINYGTQKQETDFFTVAKNVTEAWGRQSR